MASNSKSAEVQEISDLRNRVEWLDEERRNLVRKLSKLEHTLTLQEREIEGREQRIQDLEKQLSSTSAQISRMSQLDTQLSQFKDEIVLMIEQYDKRRIRAENEMDRLRRVEHEVIAREMADVRKEMPAIGRLQNEMDLRVAEETRLARLIGEHNNKLSALQNLVDDRANALTFVEQKEKQNSRNIADIQATLPESNKRLQGVRDQLEAMRTSIIRVEGNQQALVEEQAKIKDSLQSWMEQIQIGEYERNQRLEKWQRVLVEHDEDREKFNQEWVTFSDQYKEARMAVQTLTEWQKQLEQQQRESTEKLRLEAQRLQSRWDDFQLDNENKWKNFAIESDQRWSNSARHEKALLEQIRALDETLEKLTQDRDLLQRIQTAQADAIKRLPLLWMEEVEKAIAQNPHRRRQPALVSVREE